jgi:redox-sensitive bicupin YhaK (pirin superfamily)
MVQHDERQITHRLSGAQKGRIRRLISPSPEGEILKPFVFLDYFDSGDVVAPSQGFPIHPHSGIATLTYLFEGAVQCEDSTGKSDRVEAGGIEWMRAGKGVWHKGTPVAGKPIRGFQLWLALPSDQELSPAQSCYLHPREVPSAGPTRVLLGSHHGVVSAIPAPGVVNYFAVELAAGERWRHQPPAGHSVAWLALSKGALQAGDSTLKDEAVVFDSTERPVEVTALGATSFVFGSAAVHPHDLITGYYSIHTSPEALRAGEAEIERQRPEAAA